MPPHPKRSTERRRRNLESRVDKIQIAGPVKVPRGDAGWHPIAKRWYRALKDSGQSRFFEPSDWAAAYYVAELMSRHLNADRLSAQLFSGIWTAMSDLLVTEAQRRKVRLEIERADGGGEERAGVTVLDEYRGALGV